MDNPTRERPRWGDHRGEQSLRGGKIEPPRVEAYAGASYRLVLWGAAAVASEASITHCIALLRHGDGAAAQVIWERYYPQLVRLARQQLAGLSCHATDAEDIALSALDRLCRAAQQGRYPDLADRHGLWRLLLQITARRVRDQARYERRQRRGAGRVHGESEGADESGPGGHRLDGVADDAPTPEFAAAMAEQCRRLLARLEEPRLQALAVAKMDGSTNEEIAGRMGCSVRTVERRLKLIRDIWRDEEPSDAAPF